MISERLRHLEIGSQILSVANQVRLSRRGLFQLLFLRCVLPQATPTPETELPDSTDNILTDKPKSPITIKPIPPKQELEDHSDTFDTDYVYNSLIPALTVPKTDVYQKLQLILDNLSWVSSMQSGGNALRIDESGYYLTVSHNFYQKDIQKQPPYTLRAPAFQVYHPQSGTFSGVRTVFLNNETEIAIVHAPNGNDKRPIEGMQFAWDLPFAPAKLWILYLQDAMSPELHIGITKGTYRYWSLDDMFNGYIPQLEESFILEGAIPPWGSSGAPIVDDQATIIGLEQGSYPRAQNINELLGGIGVPFRSLLLGFNHTLSIFNSESTSRG